MYLDLNQDLDASPSLYYAEASGCIPSIWMYSLDLDASGSESGSGCISKPILCRGFWMYPLDLDASGSESGSGCIHWIRMHLDLDLDLDASTGSVCIWI